MGISFVDQVVIVTGAGRGLGRAYALEFARRGASVVVNDVEPASADQVVAEISGLGNVAVASYESVSTPEGGRVIADVAVSHFGRLDALVHNAGVRSSRPIDEIGVEDLDPVIDVSLRGAFFLVRPCWNEMKRANYGRIVLVSSSSAVFGRDGGTPYAAAKAGLYGFTRALAHEGAEYGIIVNAIMPFADTGRSGARLAGGALTQRIGQALRQLYDFGLPPSDVAPLVAFLASAHCVTGGHAYWTCARKVAEVFAGLTSGWSASPHDPFTAESIEEHLAEIANRASFVVPASIAEELDLVVDDLKVRGLMA